MATVSENNKRIAQNTIFLYIRMFVILCVGLYTSRVVLKVLGASDFGLYNVVGGIVTMFVFLSNTMATAVQRFFAYELGTGDSKKLRLLFSTSIILFLALSFLIFILAETIGLWFVCNKLNIPAERYDAAIFVYHWSVLSFIIMLLRTPYNALIIAHEKMGFYAWTSIAEAALKLSIVFLLVAVGFDKLKLYSILTFAVVLVISITYIIFCRIKFEETRISTTVNKSLFRSILSFSNWNLLGSISNVLMDQGVNILLNIFFGATINAARGIAYQVKGQVMAFVGGFQSATNPQIIKYYSSGKIEEMKKLLFRGSRFTFYLLFFIALPILLEIEQLLDWWLGNYPEYTALFVRLVILIILVDSLSGCILPAIQATGDIKKYQAGVSIVKLLNLPISYLLLKNGFTPDYTMKVSIALNILCLFVRMHELRRLLGVQYMEYIKEVLYYDLLVVLCGCILPITCYTLTDKSLHSFFYICSLSIISVTASVYLIGMKRNERKHIIEFIRRKIHV